MMRIFIRILYVALCAFLANNSYAGIYGRVLDKSNKEPLQGCIVVAKNGDGKVLNHTSTDEHGSFRLDTKVDTATTLSVSLMSYASQEISLLGASYPLTILMEEQVFELKEVAVRAKRIRAQGDTIAYYVSTFAQTNDQAIGEVLKRMPGIEVESSGKIKYQGVDINKFYIEGQDLLGNKYGVATMGIAANDIGAVEVMERHQPMQVLHGFSISDQAAINLKLKKGKKTVWLAHGSIGGGYSQSPKSPLWSGDLFVLSAMSRSQTLLSLKSNNNGFDLSDEQTEFNETPRGTEIGDYFALTSPAPPSLKPERTTLNISSIASLNHLYKTRNEIDIKLQVDYLSNRLASRNKAKMTYFLDGGDKIIIEDKEDVMKENMVRANVTVVANQPTYYLQNSTKAQFDWDNMEFSTLGTFNNSQNANQRNYYANNSFRLIKRFGDRHLVTFNSTNEWESRPSTLIIKDDVETRGQKINSQAFFTDEQAFYDFQIGRFVIGVNAGFQGLFRRVSGRQINSVTNQPFSISNFYTFLASPKAEWRHRKVRFVLSFPISYRHYDFRDLWEDKNLLIYSPTLSFNWQPNSALSLTFRGGSGTTPLSLNNLYQGVVVTNYRSFSYGYEDLLMTKRQNISARLSYRNPSKGVFSNLIVMHHWINNPYRMKQDFKDNYIYHAYERTDSKSRIFNATGSFNKTLDFMRGGFGINAMYSRTSRDIISQQSVVPFALNLLTIGSMLNGNTSKDFFFLYQFEFSRSWLDTPTRITTALNNYIHSLKLVYTPIDPLSIELKGEYYHNEITKDVDKKITMMDANITWRVNKKIDLIASITNILNNNEYVYTSYGLLNSYSVNHQIRGREALFTLRIK
ncbi:carboxypeptidase-like regulatory domain-containing protein [Porphyromonas levii]|uniref:carboxypeptidase-like regulatory domain-containing protein n=1 Tax=Porphyromonas levii TaxID=28114 RepID=UPI001B8CA451